MKKYLPLFAALSLFCISANAATSSETAAGKYLASIIDKPQQIRKFVQDMPKGGDLHHHASGSTFAERMLEYAAQDNLCVDRTTFTVSANKECPINDLLNTAVKNIEFKDALIDAWSMQHFFPGKESGHDHFFKTFSKFGLIAHEHTGEILAEIADRAANQNELYVETMITADGGR